MCQMSIHTKFQLLLCSKLEISVPYYENLKHPLCFSEITQVFQYLQTVLIFIR